MLIEATCGKAQIRFLFHIPIFLPLVSPPLQFMLVVSVRLITLKLGLEKSLSNRNCVLCPSFHSSSWSPDPKSGGIGKPGLCEGMRWGGPPVWLQVDTRKETMADTWHLLQGLKKEVGYIWKGTLQENRTMLSDPWSVHSYKVRNRV